MNTMIRITFSYALLLRKPTDAIDSLLFHGLRRLAASACDGPVHAIFLMPNISRKHLHQMVFMVMKVLPTTVNLPSKRRDFDMTLTRKFDTSNT